MKSLFAMSITLGMLMFPTVMAQDTASTPDTPDRAATSGVPQTEPVEVAFNGTESPDRTILQRQPSTVIQEPQSTIIQEPIIVEPIPETVVAAPVTAPGVPAGGAAVIPYGQDGLPLGWEGRTWTSPAVVSPQPQQVTSGIDQGATTVLTTETPGETIVVAPAGVEDGLVTTPVALDEQVVTAGAVTPVVVPYAQDGLPLSVSDSQVSGGGEVPVAAPAVSDGGMRCPMMMHQQGMMMHPCPMTGGSSTSTGGMMDGSMMTGGGTAMVDLASTQETLVSSVHGMECVGAVCPPGVLGAPAMGVSAEYIERNTPFSVDRLAPMQDGGVMVTYSTPFESDEVLTINPQNVPVLMTPDPGGTLMTHPMKSAALHENQIIIVDRRIDLADLQDNLFPVSTFTEISVVPGPGFEREVSLTAFPSHTPITVADFNRPLPASLTASSVVMTEAGERVVVYDEMGTPVLIDVGMPVDGLVVQTPGEIPVAFTSALPPGWRGVSVGNSMLILDSQGVIRDIVPIF